MTKSLVDHPEMFELVAPWVKMNFYSRDKDHTGSNRHRLDLRRPPDDLLWQLLNWEKSCVACGKQMHPFRQRPDGSVYYAAACPLRPSDETKAQWVELASTGPEAGVRQALVVASESYGGGCSKGTAASQEYQRVKAALRARPSEQPSFEEAMALAHGEAPPKPVPLPEEEERDEAVTGDMWSYFIGVFEGDELELGRTKVGESKTPMKRIRGLQAQQGSRSVQLMFLGVTKRYHEKELHRRFTVEHEVFEWFSSTERLLGFAQRACSPADLHSLPGYDSKWDATARGLRWEPSR